MIVFPSDSKIKQTKSIRNIRIRQSNLKYDAKYQFQILIFESLLYILKKKILDYINQDMLPKAFAKLLLILTITQLVLVSAEEDSQDIIFTKGYEDNAKLTLNQDKQLFQEDMTYRSMVRAQNLARAMYVNEKYGEHFTAGETIFTSYTNQEFMKLFTGGLLPKELSKVVKPSKGSIRNLQEEIVTANSLAEANEDDEEPDTLFTEKVGEPIMQKKKKGSNQIISGQTSWSVDWTTSARILVTSVKNQGSCGSCWAFSTTAQMESFFIRTNTSYTHTTIDMAEQQCTHCAMNGANGCNGGYANSCHNYALNNKILNQIDLPYTRTSNPSVCSTQSFIDLINNNGRYQIRSYSRLSGQSAITSSLRSTGPISICTRSDNFWQIYCRGVIPSCSLSSTSGHCYLLVGASSNGGSSTSSNFWKFKNSWGTSWGESGYFRAFRSNTDLTNGYCNMYLYSQIRTAS